MRNVLWLAGMWLASTFVRGMAAILLMACMSIAISGETPPDAELAKIVAFTCLMLLMAVMTTAWEWMEFLDYRKSREQGDG